MPRIAFVTNLCPHYRVRTFETLAARESVDFFFFSEGRDPFWLTEHGVKSGSFRHRYLPGLRLGSTRITPTLPWSLLTGRYDVFIKCINGRFALPVTFLAARIARRPFVLWTGLWSRIDTPAHRLFFPLTRFIYRHADAVVAYGTHVKTYLVSEGVDAARIFVGPHAIDNDAYRRPVPGAQTAAFRSSIGVDATTRIVLFLGRLEAAKGLDTLLRAFALLADVNSVLVLAGTGAYRDHLQALSRQLGIDRRVKFIGYVQPDETRPILASATVLTLPSVTTPTFKEPWGLVVNEAFNQGVPVVVTNAVGAAAGGLVVDGENGLVVPEGDAAQLSAALRRLLLDPAERERMGAAARGAILNWNNDAMVDGFMRAVTYALAAANLPS